MTQTERRIFLINALLAENAEYSGMEIPSGEEEQRIMLRSLMNVRPPMPVLAEFLKIQDEYLQERIKQNGITDCSMLAPVGADSVNSRIFLWKGDITALKCDAIVNACNSKMLGCFAPMHLCIDNAIHTFAGVQLRIEMNRIMQTQGHDEPAGQAKITSGYNLPATHILHTVGPIISGGRPSAEDHKMLRSCYASCLRLAAESGLKSIAFCCISTGVFAFPKHEAAKTAIKAVKDFLAADNSIKQAIFNVYGEEDYAIYRQELGML